MSLIITPSYLGCVTFHGVFKEQMVTLTPGKIARKFEAYQSICHLKETEESSLDTPNLSRCLHDCRKHKLTYWPENPGLSNRANLLHVLRKHSWGFYT